VVSKTPEVRRKPKASAEAPTFKKVYAYPNPKALDFFFYDLSRNKNRQVWGIDRPALANSMGHQFEGLAVSLLFFGLSSFFQGVPCFFLAVGLSQTLQPRGSSRCRYTVRNPFLVTS